MRYGLQILMNPYVESVFRLVTDKKIPSSLYESGISLFTYFSLTNSLKVQHETAEEPPSKKQKIDPYQAKSPTADNVLLSPTATNFDTSIWSSADTSNSAPVPPTHILPQTNHRDIIEQQKQLHKVLLVNFPKCGSNIRTITAGTVQSRS